MKNNEPKIVEKEKIVAEKLNGRFAMLGFVALVGAYLTTGQIIPPMIFAISAFTVISLSVGVMFDLIRKIMDFFNLFYI